jgi:hypothetical protein
VAGAGDFPVARQRWTHELLVSGLEPVVCGCIGRLVEEHLLHLPAVVTIAFGAIFLFLPPLGRRPAFDGVGRDAVQQTEPATRLRETMGGVRRDPPKDTAQEAFTAPLSVWDEKDFPERAAGMPFTIAMDCVRH